MRQFLLRLTAQQSRFLHSMHPAKAAGLGYLSYVLVGWLLLCLPFAQRVATGALDHLFIATSAVSTTGLTTVSVSDSYTVFGQIVILLLIQLGGIGYMTFGSFIVLSTRGRLSAQQETVGHTVFSLPESFRIDKFIRSVIVFTFAIEFLGALALWNAFSNAGVETPLWSAIFHSVSAFCTAGFSLYNSSFEAFAGDFWLNFIIAALSWLGALGFIVMVDCWLVITGRAKQLTLTSKIILSSSILLFSAATLLILINEPFVRGQAAETGLMASMFQSMTALTTVGFNTIPIGEVSKATLVVLIILMLVGASPSGTGGGMKCTTISALWGVMRSVMRGDLEVRFWKRPVPLERIRTAMASFCFYIGILIAGVYCLELTESARFEQIVFEAASAIGTVGLSTGITASLTSLGKLTIIALMFLGRLGPLTFGMALFFRAREAPQKLESDLAI